MNGAGKLAMSQLKPKISIIGVGGGGGNAVNNMIAGMHHRPNCQGRADQPRFR